MFVGLAGSTALPIIVGALMEARGFGETAVGLLGSAELGGMAAASLLAAGPLRRRSRRGFGLAGVAIAVVGHGLSALPLSYSALLMMRIVAGVGEGIAVASGGAAAAGAAEPDRLFAESTVIVGLLGGLLLTALPYVSVPYGPAGAYCALAILSLTVIPFVLWLPDPPPLRGDEAEEGTPNRALGLLAITAFLLFALGQNGLWTFDERIGVGAGLSVETVGLALGVTSLLGLAGAGLAWWINVRVGRSLPIVAGVLVYVASALALIYVPNGPVFWGANLVWAIAYLFTLPFFMGTLAALDPRGRWAASGTGMASIGGAAGPLFGGLLVAAGSYPSLAWLIVGTVLLTLAFALPVTRRLDRGLSG
jgi:predicted MFS family arabinose efflux permease